MNSCLLDHIKESAQHGKKRLAILLDPDKLKVEDIETVCIRIDLIKADYIFVGGSLVEKEQTDKIVKALKMITDLPIFLFPGDHSQISEHADGLLFLSLLSGRNPEYLIDQQIKAAPKLKKMDLEVIPTGYILIDGGTNSSVLKVSNTKPIDQNNESLIIDTALAGMYIGKQIIYLEAGSGAIQPVNCGLITKVKSELNIPLVVGGGIQTKKQLNLAFSSGADIVVIGTAFENNTYKDI